MYGRMAIEDPCARRGHLLAGLCALVCLSLLAAACTRDADALGDGSFGQVRVVEGEAVQIRGLMNLIHRDGTGYANLRTVRLAVEHFGPIHGYDVHVGIGIDEHCSTDGGRAAAETIITDTAVIGVIGTSCSVAAVGAGPLLTGAGLVMISATNTSPTLTSDLSGNPSEHFREGYFRTAHNDLYQGAAAARFLREERGVAAAAAIHTGDVYTQSLAEAFVNEFEALGGTITSAVEVNRAENDMAPVLREIALGSPRALFLPVSETVAEQIVTLAPDVADLEDMLLLGADGLLDDSFMQQPETEGMFFSGPKSQFGNNLNESTGRNADEVHAAYVNVYGSPPGSAFWGHAYDATTLLLEAIQAASRPAGNSLLIDRAGVREYLDGVAGYAGIIGAITCDDFGDCGVPRIEVIQHLDSTDIPASRANAVYEYAPLG